eukprot:scaffold2989_cov184-Amphora_coffeaeformis.AAC.10
MSAGLEGSVWRPQVFWILLMKDKDKRGAKKKKIRPSHRGGFAFGTNSHHGERGRQKSNATNTMATYCPGPATTITVCHTLERDLTILLMMGTTTITINILGLPCDSSCDPGHCIEHNDQKEARETIWADLTHFYPDPSKIKLPWMTCRAMGSKDTG